MNFFHFLFKEWSKWRGVNIDFWEAYEWYKNNFTKEEALKWRGYSVFGIGHCTPHFATSARMFGLTPEEAIEKCKKWCAEIMFKPLAVNLDYKGVIRATTATTEEPIGLATTEAIPIFDADLDTLATKETNNGKV
jgi:TPR repeat protein